MSLREHPDGADAMDFARQARPFGLKPLTKDTFGALADFVGLKSYKINDMVFEEGECGGDVYFVWKGELELQLGGHKVFVVGVALSPGHTHHTYTHTHTHVLSLLAEEDIFLPALLNALGWATSMLNGTTRLASQHNTTVGGGVNPSTQR